MSLKWHLGMILICISRVANGIEHPLLCLLGICISPLEKCSSNPWHLKNWVIWLFLLLNFVGVLYILWIQVPHHKYNLQIYSCMLWVGFFHFIFDSVFWSIKFLILMKSNIFIFSIVTCAFGVLKKALPNPRTSRLTLRFSLKSFIVLVLAFRSVIHLALIF